MSTLVPNQRTTLPRSSRIGTTRVRKGRNCAVGAAQREGHFERLLAVDRSLPALDHRRQHRGIVDRFPARAELGLGGRPGVFVPAAIVPEDVAVRIGHPGERRDVVGERVEFLAPLAQRLLDRLALVDVDHRADEAEELAGGAEAGRGCVDRPAVRAVGAAQAIFDAEWRRRRTGLDEGAFGFGGIVGMHRLEPAEAQRLGLGLPREFVPAAVEVGAMAVGLGHPHHHRGMIGHVAEARFALAQHGVDRQALGQVDDRAGCPDLCVAVA